MYIQLLCGVREELFQVFQTQLAIMVQKAEMLFDNVTYRQSFTCFRNHKQEPPRLQGKPLLAYLFDNVHSSPLIIIILALTGNLKLIVSKRAGR